MKQLFIVVRYVSSYFIHRFSINRVWTYGEHLLCYTIFVLYKNKNQIDATYYFIVLLIGSICFGHYYAHHQELAIMMLITTLVVSFLVCCILEVRCG